MTSLASDLRFVLRSLSRSPVFVIVAVASLSLGIGANTAIFSLLDQVLLRSLPVQDPQKLVSLEWSGTFRGSSFGDHLFSLPMYRDLNQKSGNLYTGLIAEFQTDADVKWQGTAERARTQLTSGNYFSVLGLRTALGRTITPPDDGTKNAGPFAVLSYAYWQKRFGGRASALNSSISINGHPFTIVGVARHGFKGLDIGNPVDVFVPLSMKAEITPTWDETNNRSAVWLRVFGRLRPGVSLEQAQAATTFLYHQEQQEDLKIFSDVTPSFREHYLKNTFALKDAAKGVSDLREQFSAPLIVLMSMVGILLLIACGNVANLLVARGTSRRREMAIRASVGASKGAIIRLVLLESAVLSLAGALLGLLLAWWCEALLLRVLPFEDTAQIFAKVPDTRALLFTLSVGVLTAVIFGMLPAIQVAKPDIAPVLKNEATAIVGGRHLLLRKSLVAAQIALSLLMLISAGLFARSLYNLLTVNSGMSTRHILTASVDPSLSGYSTERIYAAFTSLAERLSQMPGVEAISGSANPLLANDTWMASVRVDGHTATEKEDVNPVVNAVLPDFFRTLKILQIDGRDFTDADRADRPKVVIVNEAFARYFFGSTRNVVGRRLGFGNPRTAKLDMTIVGLVKDSKGTDLKEKPRRYVFVPLLQHEHPNSITFYLRTAMDPRLSAEAFRRTVHQFDAGLPVYGLKTLEVQVNETHYIERLVFFLSAAFGSLATLLAALGLYGVTSYAVERRTREIGIRLALGAQRQTVLGMVMSEVALLTSLGIAAAVPLALVVGRTFESQLFQVKGNDPLTLAAATGLLVAVGLVAGFVPASRASRIDPIRALRWE